MTEKICYEYEFKLGEVQKEAEEEERQD